MLSSPARFWRRVLGAWGVLFVAAGVICFFAYNWAQMHPFAKFTLIASLMCVSGCIAAWRGLDSPPGRLALILTALCIGPLLAVYGQTYQSGADAWELFRVWTLVLVPLALAGRQTVLWLLLWLTGSAWGALYLGGLDPHVHGELPGWTEFFLAQSLFLAGWESLVHYRSNAPEHEWMRAVWFPRLVAFFILGMLSLELAARILEGGRIWHEGRLLLPREGGIALYALLLAGGWLWYRTRRPDPFMISCGVFSLAALLACALARAAIGHGEDVAALLFLGLALAGITAGCGLLLRRFHQAMAPHGTTRSGTPWHSAIPLAAGGWIAAILLVAALGTCIFTIHSMRFDPEIPLFMGGIAFLALARLCMARESLFSEQFALALALAGTASVACAVVLFTDNGGGERLAPLAAGLAVTAIWPCIRNSAYRHIAAVCGLLLIFWGLDLLIWHDAYMYVRHDDMMFRNMYARQILHTALYAVLCVGMAHGWLTEELWRADALLRGLLPPLLRGIYCLLLTGAALSLLNRSVADAFGVVEALRATAGLGAGAGLLYCAWRMSAAACGRSSLRPLLLGLAALVAIGGYFLPGLSVGLLGLTLGKYRNDAVAIGIVIVALIAYFFLYYYNLDTTLLHKSLTLMGSGAGLCLAAFCVYRAGERNEFALEAEGGGDA